MRQAQARASAGDDLDLAIALVWGHLHCGQFEAADQLARGCLRVWPDDERLLVMAAFAAVELGRTLDETTVLSLRKASCREWTDLILLRAVKAKEISC